jgi:crotonobetainyl-CoA:carnitine CoA-transferase CaiB-like acyl-CoA transferase
VTQSQSPAGPGESARLLEGVRVVELAIVPSLPVSLAAKLLADLGAEVTVVRPGHGNRESAGSPEQRYLGTLLNEGKRALRAPAGPGRSEDSELTGLIATAEVILAPPALGEGYRGLEYEAVAAVNPDVIYGVATPFSDDQDPRWRSSDLVLQAMGGMLRTTGQPGEPPTKIGVPIGDHLGALYLAIGCLLGLVRERSAGAGRVTVSLVDAVASSLNNFVAEYKGKGHLPEPLGNRHLASSPWNLYPAADGYLVICLITDRQWDQLAELMGRHELVGHADFHGQHNRRPRADQIDEIVTAWSRQHSVQDLLASLSARAIPCAGISSIGQVLGDKTLFDRGLLRASDGADGAEVVGLGPLFRVSESVTSSADPRSAEPVTDTVRADAVRADLVPDGPLAGLRVVEFGVAAAGPVCGRILANLGAEVIKVEPPGGEIGRRVPPTIGSISAVFHLNSNDKRSLCADLTSEQGAQIARRVIDAADVVVENLAPGRLASWGLEFGAIAAAHPGLIWTSVTGFGQGSVGTRVRAYDTVVQAASGVMALTGFPDGLPTKAGISLSDFIGGVTGAFATTAALVARRRAAAAGRRPTSRHLDVAMYDATVWTTLSAWPQYLMYGLGPARNGNLDRDVLWQGLLSCDDGQVALTLRDSADGASLRALMAAGAAPVPIGEGLDGLLPVLTGWAAGLSAARAAELLQSAGLAAGPVLGVIELMADPGMDRRGVITTAQHWLDGEVAVMRVPIQLPGVTARRPRPAPTLGADTTDVLRNVAGYGEQEVAEFLSGPSVIQA